MCNGHFCRILSWPFRIYWQTFLLLMNCFSWNNRYAQRSHTHTHTHFYSFHCIRHILASMDVISAFCIAISLYLSFALSSHSLSLSHSPKLPSLHLISHFIFCHFPSFTRASLIWSLVEIQPPEERHSNFVTNKVHNHISLLGFYLIKIKFQNYYHRINTLCWENSKLRFSV